MQNKCLNFQKAIAHFKRKKNWNIINSSIYCACLKKKLYGFNFQHFPSQVYFFGNINTYLLGTMISEFELVYFVLW